MNPDQIIAMTLVDMGVNETAIDNCDSEDADCYPTYFRDVFFPEMLKRLSQGEIITCTSQATCGCKHTRKRCYSFP